MPTPDPSDPPDRREEELFTLGCSKLTRHLDLCDLFHLPILNLVDSPGFAVGLEHEITGTIRRGGEWMVAFAQTSGSRVRTLHLPGLVHDPKHGLL